MMWRNDVSPQLIANILQFKPHAGAKVAINF